MGAVRRMVDGYIFLSASTRHKFESVYKQDCNEPVLTSFHPAFPVNLLDNASKVEMRKQLGLNPTDFLVGFLGDIKPYKNPDVVNFLPPILNDGRRVVPLVAGRADKMDVALFEETLATILISTHSAILLDRSRNSTMPSIEVGRRKRDSTSPAIRSPRPLSLNVHRLLTERRLRHHFSRRRSFWVIRPERPNFIMAVPWCET
jgi:hypothetical protein